VSRGREGLIHGGKGAENTRKFFVWVEGGEFNLQKKNHMVPTKFNKKRRKRVIEYQRNNHQISANKAGEFPSYEWPKNNGP